jgi:outer membrane lipoprotein SlyB
MTTTYRPISKRRLAELRGYVAWTTIVFRALLFAVAIGIVAAMLRSVHVGLGRPVIASDVVWIVPSAALAVALYRVSGRWTGGRAFRAAVRKDLAGGVAAVHQVNAVDAIEVEEQEDEGPSFFVLQDDGTTLLFTGQYLDPYKRKGFPWKMFEILEAPASKVFFGLKPVGEKLVPSRKRPPFTWEEYVRYAKPVRDYGIVAVDFEELKR